MFPEQQSPSAVPAASAPPEMHAQTPSLQIPERQYAPKLHGEP
jgi:hypothetical protein